MQPLGAHDVPLGGLGLWHAGRHLKDFLQLLDVVNGADRLHLLMMVDVLS